ncbi:MAG TPA: thioredoxin family protein [Pyrinomonadaceae bacterium]|nr:thioredoxin family protein [Pyrinomonadaceae bacterium]
MTTKKILLIVGGVVAVLALVVTLFVGGILWITFSAIGKSEAAQTARTFLQQNAQLKSDIGEVRDFGFWVTGNINSQNDDGVATLNLKVVGERKTVPASVNLSYQNGREWVVVKASYQNDAKQTVSLLNPYERNALNPNGRDAPEAGRSDTLEVGAGGAAPGDTDGAGTAAGTVGEGGFDEESFAANVLQSEGTTLVVFQSQYSVDSQALEKTLEELSGVYAERVNLVRYNVDEQPALLKRFEIRKPPVVLIYRNGEEQERRAGAISKSQLAALLDRYLETE